MTEQDRRAIEEALDKGYRVQLKKMKDGAIKMQIVSYKELKT